MTQYNKVTDVIEFAKNNETNEANLVKEVNKGNAVDDINEFYEVN